MRPRSGLSSRARMRTRVVFPAPLGPSTTRKPPGGSVKPTSSSARRAPKARVSPWTSRPGGTAATPGSGARRGSGSAEVARRLVLRGTFGEQGLGLEGAVGSESTLDDDLDAGTEDVGDGAVVDDRHAGRAGRSLGLCDREPQLARAGVALDRAGHDVAGDPDVALEPLRRGEQLVDLVVVDEVASRAGEDQPGERDRHQADPDGEAA